MNSSNYINVSSNPQTLDDSYPQDVVESTSPTHDSLESLARSINDIEHWIIELSHILSPVLSPSPTENSSDKVRVGISPDACELEKIIFELDVRVESLALKIEKLTKCTRLYSKNS